MRLLIVEAKADREVRDSNRWTPLHWAALCGNPLVAQLLLDHGADREAKDNNGWRPVDVATKCLQKTLAQLLGSGLTTTNS
jgi:ankyrin repeat protein